MPIRVLVAEDSTTVRKHLCRVLAEDPDLEVIGEAEDGRQAIELCRTLRPDVITMDMMLPVMSGLAATEYIMAHFPTPVLVVSASFNRGEVFKTYEALAAGAVDVLEKPDGTEPEGVWEQKLTSSVKLVSRIRVITHPRGLMRRAGSAGTRDRAEGARECEVVAIGASTGGPAAVQTILRALPPQFDVPILLVMHIGEKFASNLAEWLDGQSARRVACARDGDVIAAHAGRVLLAPAGKHLIVRSGKARTNVDPERHFCRPSVDVLFESVAAEYGAAAAGCVLTGMGRDGASGLLAIHQAGGFTIAQDEASSVVYGMPREAAVLGAADRILPLAEIAPAIASLGKPRAAKGGK